LGVPFAFMDPRQINLDQVAIGIIVETAMIYVHHVSKVDAADRLSTLVAAETAPEMQVVGA
jgi:hypothetical protein